MALFFDTVELTGSIQIGSTSLTPNGSYVRHNTSHGYIELGPANTSHAHILTDRSNFYFNTEIRVNSGIIGSYDEDLDLRRAGSSKITAGVNNIYIKESAVIQENWGQGDYSEQLTIVGSYPSMAFRNNAVDHKWLFHHDGNGKDFQFYEGSPYDNSTWTRRFALKNEGYFEITKANGTLISTGAATDAFGYNSNYGHYIAGNGGTYVYGNGSIYDGTANRTILHSGNVSTYALTTLPSHDHTILKEAGSISYGTPGLQWFDLSGTGGTGANGNTPANPFSDWHHHLIMNHANSGGYYVDVAYSFHNDRVHFRRNAGNSFGSWREFIHSGNVGSFALPLSGGTVNGQITASGGINMNNTSITGVDNIVINDAGYGEGIYWNGGNGWRISEAPDNLTNAAGNLQFTTGTSSRMVTFGTSGQIYHAGNIHSDGMQRPVARWGVSGSSTGMVAIALPGNTGDYDMTTIEIEVYEYNSNSGSKIRVSGHTWTSGIGWYNYAVQVEGRFNKPVRLGQNGSKYYILLGNTNSSWNYGSVIVRANTEAAYYNNVTPWQDSWSITQVTTDPTTSNSGDLNTTSSVTHYTSGMGVAEGQFRTPIYYDLNNTAYYVDPNGTTSLVSATVNNELTLPGNGTNKFIAGSGDAADYNNQNFVLSGWNGLGLYNPTSGGAFTNQTTGFYDFRNGIMSVKGSHRAPIFYDSNDTNYYLNPADTSYLNYINGPYFKQIYIGSGMGNSYDERVILLIPKVETNSSYNNRIHGKITMGKTGGNVIDYFDVEAQSVYNNTTASFTSSGQRTGHKFVTCTYNGIKWLAIKFSYTANPYNYAFFHGHAVTNFSTQATADQLKVIPYVDLSSGTTVLNSEIYNSIADYTPDPLHKTMRNGSGSSYNMYSRLNLYAPGSGWEDGLNLYSSDETNKWNLLVDNGASDQLRIAYNSSEKMRFETNGDITTLGVGYATNSFRAPTFYDSNNTNYYLNPYSNSQLQTLSMFPSTNGVGAKINFSDHASGGYTQYGILEYLHTDTASYGAGNCFKFYGTEPNMTFHVAGRGIFQAQTNADTTQNHTALLLEKTGSGNSVGIKFNSGNSQTGFLYLGGTGELAFIESLAAGQLTKFIITPTSRGRVGIGGISPNYRLHVYDGDGLGQCSLGNQASINTTIQSGITLAVRSSGAGGSTALDIEAQSYGSAAQMYMPSYSSGMTVTNSGGFSQNAFNFNYSSNNVGSIRINSTSTSYNTTSDYRLKENVTPITGAIERLNQLNPSRFTWISDPEAGTVDGFIAHEVSDVVPEAVSGEKDGVDYLGMPEYQGIDQSKLVPLLTAALQEAITKIENLENRLQVLENQ